MSNRTIMILLGWLTVSLSANPALAQEKGAGSISVEYQYIHSDLFKDDVADYEYWSTDTRVLMFFGNYTFADKWTVFAALPYIEKRFVSEVDWGGDPHNPNDAWWIDFVPPDTRFVDDGAYHGGLQDLSVTVSYQALDGPLTLSPYIGYGFPVGDYPFYAKAGIGADLWTIPVGASFSYIPYFDDWYVNGNVAYVFSEKLLGVNVDFWSVHLAAVNGSGGSSDTDNSKKLSLVTVRRIGSGRLGLSASHDRPDDERIRQIGLFGSWKTGRLVFLMEADHRNVVRSTGGETEQWMAFFETDILLSRGFNLKFAHDWIDPDRALATDAQTRTSFGVEYIPYPFVQLRYFVRLRDGPPQTVGVRDDSVELEAHFFF